jgi:hypothetical protein
VGRKVTYTQYRGLGFIATKTKEFDVGELGLIILETNRRCDPTNVKWFCLGYLGITVTKGFPAPGKPLEIAFEFPIVYNGWTFITEGCALGCYKNSFYAMCKLLGFPVWMEEQYTQNTILVGKGTPSWELQMLHMSKQLFDDSLASYDNKFAVNISALPQDPKLTKVYQEHRVALMLQS